MGELGQLRLNLNGPNYWLIPGINRLAELGPATSEIVFVS